MTGMKMARGMKGRSKAFLGFVAVLLVVSGLGCSGGKRQMVNVAAGEYYSEDDYEKLSNKEKEAYCQALSKQLAMLKRGLDDRKGELEAAKESIEKMKAELGPIESELIRIESDIRTLKHEIREFESLPKTWRIKPGECLWTIAGNESVYADPVKWPRIFRANLDKVEDPAYVYPDTVLVIPRDWPSKHRVAADECLWIIAGYWEIYDNPLEWPKIYEANKNQIKDPDLILPEQVLTIPR